MLVKTNAEGFVKDTQSNSVRNHNNAELELYLFKRDQERKFKEIYSKIAIIDEKINNIMNMLNN